MPLCGRCRARPDRVRIWRTFYLNLGKLLRKLKKYDEARTAFKEAVTLLDELQTEYRGNPEYRFELAVALTGSGNLAWKGYGDLHRAEAECGQARGLLAVLVANFPERPVYSKELANTWNSLGTISFQQGERWRTAGRLLRPLVGDGTAQVRQAQDEAAAAWQRAAQTVPGPGRALAGGGRLPGRGRTGGLQQRLVGPEARPRRRGPRPIARRHQIPAPGRASQP